MKIGLVTDSTCDLNKELIDSYNINIVPLKVHFGTKEYVDGVDINPDKFFKLIESDKNMPKTSKPSKYDFETIYNNLLKDYDHILSIHVSKGLSGTYDSAALASNDIDNNKVTVIDSSSISLGLGFLVLLAANLIENNYQLEEIIDRIHKAKENIKCIFTVEDLTYMKEGGRIGKARAFLGTIFNINPIIEISTETGKVNPLDKVRGNERTLKKMGEILVNNIKDSKKAWIGIMHGDRKNQAKSLINQISNKIPENIDKKLFTERISPTLGCHVGQSVYAFATLSGDVLDI